MSSSVAYSVLAPYNPITHLVLAPPSQCRSMSDVYTVEHIVDHREGADCAFEFLVKWQGYNASHNSWEPQDNILDPMVLRSYAEKSDINIEIEEDDTPEYEVDRVLDVRAIKGGRFEYQIQWEAGDTTWEPADEFPPSEWDEVAAFWQARGEDPPPALGIVTAKSSGSAASSSALTITGSPSASDHHTLSHRTWARYKTYGPRMK
eukprot:7388492-Prymnesium_polylepis.2